MIIEAIFELASELFVTSSMATDEKSGKGCFAVLGVLMFVIGGIALYFTFGR